MLLLPIPSPAHKLQLKYSSREPYDNGSSTRSTQDGSPARDLLPGAIVELKSLLVGLPPRQKGPRVERGQTSNVAEHGGHRPGLLLLLPASPDSSLSQSRVQSQHSVYPLFSSSCCPSRLRSVRPSALCHAQPAFASMMLES